MTVIHGFGTKFSRETVTPGTYADIAQVVNIGGPALSREAIDATSMDSSGRWRQFIAGLRDAGEVTLELLFDPDNTGQQDLRNDLSTLDTLKNYRITFPDATPTTVTFGGLITRFDPKAPMDEKLVASVTVKLSGAPTWA